MPDEPRQPPSDQEEESEKQLYPFMRAEASGGNGVVAEAGWVDEDGEVEELVHSYNGPVDASQKAIITSHTWYVARLQEVYEAQQEG